MKHRGRGRRRTLRRIAALLMLTCTFAWPRTSAEAAEPEPIATPQRVLFVLIDTLRQDRIGAYGYSRSTSPTFDRLAADGVLFTDCRSTSSWTKPAVASLFTGLSPIVHGVEKGGSADSYAARVPALSEDFETLFEAFLRNGFTTVGFCSNPHVVPQTGLAQGIVSLNQTAQSGPGLARDFIEWLDAPYAAAPDDSQRRWAAHEANLLRPISARGLELPAGVEASWTESGLRLQAGAEVVGLVCVTLPLADVPATATAHVLGLSYTLGLYSSLVVRTPGHARVVKRPAGNAPGAKTIFHKIPPGGGPLSLEVCVRGEGSGLEIAPQPFLVPDTVLRADQGEKWFAYLHLMNPHLPYLASDEHRRVFDPGDYGESPQPLSERAKKMVGGQAIRGTDDFRVYRARYDASIHEADTILDSVVGELARRSLLEDTLLVVAADHGEEFLDHGGMSHAGHPYEEKLRVPLLFYYPKGIATGKRVAGLTSLLDVYPTLVDLFGFTAETPFQGTSLLAHLRSGSEKVSPHAFMTTHTPMDPSSMARVDLLVRGRLKLIISSDDAGVESVELYDLRKDPGETRNLAAERPEDVARLRAELAVTRADHEALRDHLGNVPGEGVLGPEEVRALRSLGYLD